MTKLLAAAALAVAGCWPAHATMPPPPPSHPRPIQPVEVTRELIRQLANGSAPVADYIDPARGVQAWSIMPGAREPRRPDVKDHLCGAAAAENIPAQRLVGAAVVTDEGHLLGRVSEAHISADRPLAAFKIGENPIQSIFRGGYFLRSSVARALSPDGSRMIVPADTLERHAATSAVDAL